MPQTRTKPEICRHLVAEATAEANFTTELEAGAKIEECLVEGGAGEGNILSFPASGTRAVPGNPPSVMTPPKKVMSR